MKAFSVCMATEPVGHLVSPILSFGVCSPPHHHLRGAVQLHRTGAEGAHRVDEGHVSVLQPLHVAHQLRLRVVTAAGSTHSATATTLARVASVLRLGLTDFGDAIFLVFFSFFFSCFFLLYFSYFCYLFFYYFFFHFFFIHCIHSTDSNKCTPFLTSAPRFYVYMFIAPLAPTCYCRSHKKQIRNKTKLNL